MAAFLSEDKKQRKKNKKNKQSPTEPTPDQPMLPWLSPADTFSPVSTMTGQTETPSEFVPPRAPWMSRAASNDGDSSIFNGGGSTIGASSINTVRGRAEARDNGYETDSGRSKSKSRKLRKRSKSRARKGGNGEAGYETDDGYMSSGPAPDKTLNKSKSKSRFFKLGNRSKAHVSSDDEQDPIPPPPVPQPQAQFILPIAARFATTLGDVNKDKSVEPPLGMYPGLSGAKKQEETHERGGNPSLELSKTDSVDFSTAMNRAFANVQHQELPLKQRNDPLVHFQTPTFLPSSTSTAGPSSYHPTSPDIIGPYTRDSAGSATSSEQHPSSGTSSVTHSSIQSHGSTAPSSITSSPPSMASPASGTGLFSRFGSKRSADKPAKEVDKERSQISYPITRTGSPPRTSPKIQHEQQVMARVPPSSYSPASSVPASGRATPTSDKNNVPRPLFIHRVPSSDHVGKSLDAGFVQHPTEEPKQSPNPSPVGGGYVVLTPGLGSYPPANKVKPTPSTLVIPRTMPGPSSSPMTVTNALPSPVPSMSYIVPSPSEPTFTNPPLLQARHRTPQSDENLRSRIRVSEDTFSPPPAVFTIPPATPPPNSPLPDVPPSQVGNNVFSSQQANRTRPHYTPYSQTPQTSLLAPSVDSSRPSSPNGSSPMRGRESPFPARPTLPTSPHRGPSVANRKAAGLDGFGGRVKVKRYAELYGFQNGNRDPEDDTISIAAGGGRVPVRRDDEEEWNASVARQREEREKGRERERERIAMTHHQAQGLSSPPSAKALETSSDSKWRTHRRKQTKSTQVGIAVEEPSDGEEDEGYGGEEAYGRYGIRASIESVADNDDNDDDAGYYRRRGGFSDEDHTMSDIASGPALSRSHSIEALQRRLQDPRNMVPTSRRKGSDEQFSEDGHWQQSRSRSRPGRLEDDHHLVAQGPLLVPASPAASEDSHYSANGRYTMYEDEDSNPRATMYSDAGSFMDESRSRSTRDRFLRRVEGMYDSTGRERATPAGYLSNSGRSSPNPPYDAPASQINRLAGLATGKGRGHISHIPPVPRLPKGAVVGIVGESGEVVSSKVWI